MNALFAAKAKQKTLLSDVSGFAFKTQTPRAMRREKRGIQVAARR
jgi:hypothetical protein